MRKRQKSIIFDIWALNLLKLFYKTHILALWHYLLLLYLSVFLYKKNLPLIYGTKKQLVDMTEDKKNKKLDFFKNSIIRIYKMYNYQRDKV